eukprot:2597669-Amphidinium_carterae.2
MLYHWHNSALIGSRTPKDSAAPSMKKTLLESSAMRPASPTLALLSAGQYSALSKEVDTPCPRPICRSQCSPNTELAIPISIEN